MIRKIGIDIGNVLTDRDTDIRAFGEDYLFVPACAGAFEAVAKLVGWFGPENVFLVSKCSPENQNKSLEWLAHKSFWQITAVRQENVCFCLERHEKKEIAQRHRLTHFVDDRWTVLRHLTILGSMKKMYLFNPDFPEKTQFETEHRGDNVIVVESWRQIVDDLMAPSHRL